VNKQKLNIIADASILAIANTQKYNGTLNNQVNWTWKQFNHFIIDSNKNNMIVFDTAVENEYTFACLVNEVSDQAYFRKFEQSIEVTDNSLYLINWTDLTSSLQFKDALLPSELNKDLKINLKNGYYKAIVKQLFNPEEDEYDPDDKINFIIEFLIQSENPNLHPQKIMWADNFPNDESVFLSSERNEFDDLLDKMISESK
jgi:hypothetical protein